MLTTTSTSYLLLASLDTARRYLATQGKERIGKALQLAGLARRRINEIPGLRCVGREILGGEATHAMDETKLIIHLHSLGITGYDDGELGFGNSGISRWKLSDPVQHSVFPYSREFAESIGIAFSASTGGVCPKGFNAQEGKGR